MVLPSNIGFWAFILSTFFTFDTLCSLPVSSSRANHWNLRQKNIVFSVKKNPWTTPKPREFKVAQRRTVPLNWACCCLGSCQTTLPRLVTPGWLGLAMGTTHQKSWESCGAQCNQHSQIVIWLVAWNIFPYIGNNHPNWLSYFSEGLKPPIRLYVSWLWGNLGMILWYNYNTCGIISDDYGIIVSRSSPVEVYW